MGNGGLFMNLEELNKLFKKELNTTLTENDYKDYASKDLNYRVHRHYNGKTWYVILTAQRRDYHIEVFAHAVTNISQVKALIRKFKKLRKVR